MNSHFTPDNYQRKDKRSITSEKSERSDDLLKNQPRVKIWTVTLFQPKPRDRIIHYLVSSEKVLDTKKVAERMAELYGMNVYLYGSLFNFFEVYLETAVEFHVVERVTLQVLSEFDA